MNRPAAKATKTVDAVLFCRQCGSPSLDFLTEGHLLGSEAVCAACGWIGKTTDLLSAPVVHQFTGHDEIVKELMGDLRLSMAKHWAKPLAVFLAKWGFLTEKNDHKRVKVLSRYMAVASMAVITAVIQERRKMAVEESNVGQ